MSITRYIALVDVVCTTNNEEEPYLFVLELDHFIIAPDNFVAFVLGGLEQFWQSKSLACHLIPVIGVDKLVRRHNLVYIS